MKNSQYYGIIGTIWIASYKPDLFNLIIGVVILVVGIAALYREINATPD